ncbi:nitrilase superfamily member [Scheffersomyces xylosifermentans]|uniref:nitrilase superfamily member n=1 Tax=Scheffersomyces xylosifermentans TaxID=1304137 RepID=UPI00315DEC84
MSLSNTLRVAVGQLCSSSNLSHNARVINKLIHQAVKNQVTVLFLPEASDYISRNAQHSYELAQTTHSQFVSVIQNELRQLKLSDFYVAIGIHEPTERADKRVQNNQIWLNSQGEVICRYQKVHLFDVNIKNGPILQESKSVEPGNKIEDPIPVGKFSVGLAICYDIRFPELALRLRKLGASIITYPSAFTTKTGEAHWELLGRARAVDSQCFVVMAAQCGEHDIYADKEPEAGEEVKKRVSYGESLIIDPWGAVIGRGKKYTDELAADEEGDYYELVWADLDYEKLEGIRKNMPLLEHRRPDVFGYEI